MNEIKKENSNGRLKQLYERKNKKRKNKKDCNECEFKSVCEIKNYEKCGMDPEDYNK